MKKYLTKRNLIIAGVLLLLVVILIPILRKPAQNTTSNVSYQQVRQGNIKVTVSGSGQIEAVSRAEVTSNTSGTIKKINVTEGKKVNKGDLLFTLGNDSLNLNLEKAELTLAQAKDSLSQKKKEKNNLTINSSAAGTVISVKAGSGSNVMVGSTIAVVSDGKSNQEIKATGQGEIATVYIKAGDTVYSGQKVASLSADSINSSINTLNLQVKQAQLDLEEKQQSVNDLKVYAPISGTYSGLDVNVGDTVGAGSGQSSSSSSAVTSALSQAAGKSSSSMSSSSSSSSSGSSLGVVSDDSAMKVVIAVDELDIAKVKIGQKAKVTAAAIADKNYEAAVSEIAQEGNYSNGASTFNVTVTINEPTGLKAGMSADVEIDVIQKSNILILPIEAVQGDKNNQFVLVPRSGESETNAQAGGQNARPYSRVKIKTGIHDEQSIEIVSGLTEGQEVMLPTLSSSQNQNRGFGGFGMMGGRPDKNRQGSGSSQGSGGASNSR